MAKDAVEIAVSGAGNQTRDWQLTDGIHLSITRWRFTGIDRVNVFPIAGTFIDYPIEIVLSEGKTSVFAFSNWLLFWLKLNGIGTTVTET